MGNLERAANWFRHNPEKRKKLIAFFENSPSELKAWLQTFVKAENSIRRASMVTFFGTIIYAIILIASKCCGCCQCKCGTHAYTKYAMMSLLAVLLGGSIYLWTWYRHW